MIAIAERVEAIPCATTLEARIRELRLISQRRPHYNRKSRQASTSWWLRLAPRPTPRLVATKSADGSIPEGGWGPFTSRSAARHVAETITRLVHGPGGLGGFGEFGGAQLDALAIAKIERVLAGDVREVLLCADERMRALAREERFEEAGHVRDSAIELSHASARCQRFRGLVEAGQVVAAEPDTRGGWAIHVIRDGRLVSAAHCPAGADARASAQAAIATAECSDTALTTAEETTTLARWLESPGVRLVEARTPLAWPIGSGSSLSLLDIACFDPQSNSGHRSDAARPVGPAPGIGRVSRIRRAG